ncbi:hypothetical protein B0H11DRAFT_2284635 [Mycena galericulata]|nr:hypothetical protein B0H11DRAFT_2284635 [Mycena galericulata]
MLLSKSLVSTFSPTHSYTTGIPGLLMDALRSRRSTRPLTQSMPSDTKSAFNPKDIKTWHRGPMHPGKDWSCDWENWDYAHEFHNPQGCFSTPMMRHIYQIAGKVEPLAFVSRKISTEPTFVFVMGGVYYWYHYGLLRRYWGPFADHNDFLEHLAQETMLGGDVEATCVCILLRISSEVKPLWKLERGRPDWGAFGEPAFSDMRLMAGRILELVDHTLGFLDAAAEDLRACALVSRSWVYPAQSRIFAEIDVGYDARLGFTGSRLTTLLATLEASPHLVGFISCLSIRNVAFTRLSQLEALSLLPYKRLVTLYVSGDRGGSSHFTAYLPIQRLLRIPSLTSVTILCTFTEEEMFFRIWEGCSGNIRHLGHWGNVAGGSSQGFAGHKHIKLHSLVDWNRSPAIESWLNDPRCPFDVSALKAFKFHQVEDQLRGELSTARETVEVAAIAAMRGVINLSLFRRLVQLEITSSAHGFVFDFRSISTLAPENRAHLEAIRFRILQSREPDLEGLFINLDRQISGIQGDFPNLKIVEVVMREYLFGGISDGIQPLSGMLECEATYV